MPLSSGYDFIGKQPRKSRIRAIQEEVVQEESSVVPNEPVKEPEVTVEDSPAPETEEEETVEEVVLPEVEQPVKETKPSESSVKVEPKVVSESEDIPVQEEKPTFYEIEYASLPVGNAMDKLPASESGNYVIVYRSDNCIYCDKLIDELKGNIGDYILVVVKCSGSVRDPFYTRMVYNYYPSFLVIKDKKVKYYGYGYRSLGEFKRFL